MNASIIRSCLVSGVAAVSVTGFVLVPAASPTPLARPKPAVALTAHVESLAARASSGLVHHIPDLINQQATFHIALVADFVATGAVLVDRQLQIPGTLVRDIQNGAPIPVAVGRALQTFIEIELDAGRELIGFAARYVDFQIRFIAQVVEDVITASTSVLAAVGDAITPKTTAVAPEPRLVEAVIERVIPAQPSDTAPDNAAETRIADSARPTMSLSTPDDKTTVSAQGEIRSSSSETASPPAPATSDENAPAQRDDATDGDTSDRAESEPVESEQHRPDTAEADQQPTDSQGSAAGDGGESASDDE